MNNVRFLLFLYSADSAGGWCFTTCIPLGSPLLCVVVHGCGDLLVLLFGFSVLIPHSYDDDKGRTVCLRLE